MSSNSDLYARELFEKWSNKQGIIASEEYLIRKYISEKEFSILEAGTGGGRISFYLETLSFTNISAFDIVPEMIQAANTEAQKRASCIRFLEADASDLSAYSQSRFQYLIYFQQVLCFLENDESFLKALQEAYRVAAPNSTCIFSFLDFDARKLNIPLSYILRLLRFFRNEKTGYQYLPWLKINSSFNWKFLAKKQPLLYWVKEDEVLRQMKNIGFSILEVLHDSDIPGNDKKRKGMLYMVCTKY